MKKLTIAMLTFVMSICFSLPVMASQVYVDGQKLDVTVSSENGTTLIPMRAIFQSLGADVDWNNNTLTVTAAKDQTIIDLQIGSKTAYINNRPVSLQVPGKLLYGNTTMVPLRFVSEALGAEVSWDSSTNTINIFTTNAYTEPQQVQNSMGRNQNVSKAYTYPDQQQYVTILDYGINNAKQQHAQMMNAYKIEISSIEAQLKELKDTMEDEKKYFNEQRFNEHQSAMLQAAQRGIVSTSGAHEGLMKGVDTRYENNIRAVEKRFRPYIEQCEEAIESYEQELSYYEDLFDKDLDILYDLRNRALNNQLTAEEIRLINNAIN